MIVISSSQRYRIFLTNKLFSHIKELSYHLNSKEINYLFCIIEKELLFLHYWKNIIKKQLDYG